MTAPTKAPTPADAQAIDTDALEAPNAELDAAGVAETSGELGGTGLRGSEPHSGGFLWEDFQSQLRGQNGARIFKEMAENDPMCGAVLFAFTMLMKNVDWSIVEPKDTGAEAVELAEFAESVLFRDMAHPFSSFIDNAASMLTYGYAPHEIVWKVRDGETADEWSSSQYDDGLIGLAGLPIRSQDTVWRWLFDDDGRGRVLGLEQFRMGKPNAIIPMSKLLNCRTTDARDNPEGRSILRNAYRTWVRKSTIEDAEGRAAVRTAGVVTLRIPAKFMDPAASTNDKRVYAAYRALAETLANDRGGYCVLPSDRDDKGNALYEVGFTTTDSDSAPDMSPIVERMDARIAVTMLADWLLLGTKNVGSWALADSKTSFFVLAVEGFLGAIADQLNRKLLPKLWRVNGLPAELRPTVKFGSVQPPDLERLAAFLEKMTRAGAPVFPSKGEKLEAFLLRLAGLPDGMEEG